MRYTEKLGAAIRSSGSCLCVGLDPNPELMPEEVDNKTGSRAGRISAFLKQVIDLTGTHCAAYKPNLGFFEALGSEGWTLFEEILEYIPGDKVIIADAKRGDIDSTAEQYARAFFHTFDVDAVTLNPLMGFETLSPFLQYEEKGIYVLTLTSNPGAADILTKPTEGYPTVAEYIADRLGKEQETSRTDIGMVLGATKAGALKPLIERFPGASLLIPGIGKQGGSADELVQVLQPHRGLVLVNASRSIIYAGNRSGEWKKSVSAKAGEMKKKLSPLIKENV